MSGPKVERATLLTQAEKRGIELARLPRAERAPAIAKALIAARTAGMQQAVTMLRDPSRRRDYVAFGAMALPMAANDILKAAEEESR